MSTHCPAIIRRLNSTTARQAGQLLSVLWCLEDVVLGDVRFIMNRLRRWYLAHLFYRGADYEFGEGSSNATMLFNTHCKELYTAMEGY